MLQLACSSNFLEWGAAMHKLSPVLKRGGRVGKRPRTLFAAMVGTFICFSLFVYHYMRASDDSGAVIVAACSPPLSMPLFMKATAFLRSPTAVLPERARRA